MNKTPIKKKSSKDSNPLEPKEYVGYKAEIKGGVDFVTIVAHQMRTPLTAVKWYIDLLLSGKAGELKHEQRDYLLDIYQSNERMIRLVDNLLIIEQLEQDVLPIVQRKTSIAGIIRGIVNEYDTFANVNHIALIYHCDGSNLPSTNIDPIYIRLAFKNIIDNALRYTPKRGTVVISCEEIFENGRRSIILKISDTGIGIPPEEQDKIFKKFYRSSKSMAMQTEGTGLGLFIAKVIVEKNGGEIWFESREILTDQVQSTSVLPKKIYNNQPNRVGTTFFIKIPVK